MTEQFVPLLTLKTNEQGANTKGCGAGKVLSYFSLRSLSTGMGKSGVVRSARWWSTEAWRMLLHYIM